MKHKAILIAITLIAATATAICHATETEKPETEKLPNGGEVQFFTIASKSMEGREIKGGVILPPQYFDESKADEKFPVIYMTHGYGQPWQHYSRLPYWRSPKYAEKPVIGVFFDGNQSSGNIFHLDTPDPQMRYTSFFFDDLMPYVEKNFRVSDSRHLAGFSWGAFGAMHYALTKPELFKTITSAACGLNYSDKVDGREPHSLLVRLLTPHYGEFDPEKEEWAKISIYKRVGKALKDGVKLPAVLLLNGVDHAPDIANARSFVKYWEEPFKEKGQTLRSEEHPGAHDWPLLRDTFPIMMEHVWKNR